MAVVDIYSSAAKESGNGKKFPALNGSGTEVFYVEAYASIAAADNDTSVYRLFPDVPSNLIPLNICIQNEAITGGTSYDLGIYKVSNGAVVDKDILAATLDMSSARTVATWNNLGMTSVPITQATSKNLATLSAQAAPDPSYDIALTANTVGSGAGVILAKMFYTYK